MLALDCQIQGQNPRIWQSGGSTSLKPIKSLIFFISLCLCSLRSLWLDNFCPQIEIHPSVTADRRSVIMLTAVCRRWSAVVFQNRQRRLSDPTTEGEEINEADVAAVGLDVNLQVRGQVAEPIKIGYGHDGVIGGGDEAEKLRQAERCSRLRINLSQLLSSLLK